ncbi:MAG: HDOD domain-containing protein [Planctomycetota bacterium]|nr:HDOD domain-containing protein [Planctomycetota bacterium]
MPLTKEDVQKRLDDLTSFPTTILRLMSLDMDSDDAMAQIVSITETDPALTARLFSIANSAGYAPEVEITNLGQAVARIGGRRVAELIYSIALMRLFEPTNAEERELWTHALATAVTARTLCGVWPSVAVPSEAYLAGLMHDIGRFILLKGVPEELQRGDEFGWFSSTGLLSAERDAIGRDHAELGYELCERIGLPMRIRTVVRYHHHFGRQYFDKVPEAERDLVGLVQISEFCASLLYAKPDPLELEADQLLHLLDRRGEHLFHVQAIATLGELAEQLPRIDREVSALLESMGF